MSNQFNGFTHHGHYYPFSSSDAQSPNLYDALYDNSRELWASAYNPLPTYAIESNDGNPAHIQPSFHAVNVPISRFSALSPNLPPLTPSPPPAVIRNPRPNTVQHELQLTPIPCRRWVGGHRWNPTSAREPTIIEFTMDHRRGKKHMMARDALDRNYSELVCRDQSMHLGGSSVSLRFEWPGYKSWTRQIKTTDWTGSRNPITGAKLVTEIAKVLDRFIRTVQGLAITSADQEWLVGPVDSGRISIREISILAVHRVSKGSWQVVFGRMA